MWSTEPFTEVAYFYFSKNFPLLISYCYLLNFKENPLCQLPWNGSQINKNEAAIIDDSRLTCLLLKPSSNTCFLNYFEKYSEQALYDHYILCSYFERNLKCSISLVIWKHEFITHIKIKWKGKLSNRKLC